LGKSSWIRASCLPVRYTNDALNAERHDSLRPHPALVYALIFAAILLLHAPLLNLPYFWDEAGYYVPAARDLFLSGGLIPHSTPSNAHPPLVMAYLAGGWKVAGYSTTVTRTAMLAIAAFALLGVFRLAERVANREVAIASTVCTAIYPVFFTQSSLAQVDLAAAGFTIWGLLAFIDGRRAATVAWFSLAALSKETAILTPLALFAWDRVGSSRIRESKDLPPHSAPSRSRTAVLIPVLPLIAWYAYHWLRTGYVFGNPEFFRYNVEATLSPLRMLLALGMRLWQITGYLDLYLLTLATLTVLWLPPLRDAGGERQRIEPAIQLVFLTIIGTYSMAMAIIGGAELARYMLPALPLVIIVCVSTLRRRVRLWRWVIALVVMAFIAGLTVNPPYGFALEDNLSYRDYIIMHQNAEQFLESRYPMAHVLTAWPASDELTRPYLGYVSRPMRAVRIDDFSLDQMMSAADLRNSLDVALVFSTKYEPPHPLVTNWKAWDQIRTRYFGYHRDLPPAAAARMLGGEIVYSDTRDGQWIAVIELGQVRDAAAFPRTHPDPIGLP